MVKWRWVWVLVSDKFMGCGDRTASTASRPGSSTARSRDRGHHPPPTKPVVAAFGFNRSRKTYRGPATRRHRSRAHRDGGCRPHVGAASPRRYLAEVWGFRWGRHELDRPHARCSQRRESYTYLGRTGENVPSFAGSFAAADFW